MATINVSDTTFESEVISSEQPVLVDFWAEWCGPCRMIGPIVEELAGEYDGKAVIGKLDVDTNQETSIKYSVRSIPTILLFKDGELVDRQVGAVPKETLSKAINAQL